jgi:hypothetical protein
MKRIIAFFKYWLCRFGLPRKAKLEFYNHEINKWIDISDNVKNIDSIDSIDVSSILINEGININH